MTSNNVKIVYFSVERPIIGNILSEDDDTITIENPTLVIFGGEGFQFLPFMMMTQENVFVANKDKLFSDSLYEPDTEMVNNYNRMFGAGIEIATPDKIGVINQ